MRRPRSTSRPTVTWEAVFNTADAVLQAVLDAIGDRKEMKDRTGGYLNIADMTGVSHLLMAIGSMPEEKRLDYQRNALEKAQRLAHYALSGHYLSRQSRNPDRKWWTGAARGTVRIYSFSGLVEDADELFSVLLALALGDLLAEDALHYLRDNKYREEVKILIEQFDGYLRKAA